MKTLIHDIQTKSFKNIYVFYGEERYLIKKYEKQLKQAAMSDDSDMMNTDVFEGKTCSVDKIMDAAETAPFFSAYRLVIVKNSELFSVGRKDDSDKMATYLSSVPETTILLFLEEKVDKRSKIYKNINSASVGLCVEFVTPPENELAKWVIDMFKDKQYQITAAAAHYLLRNVLNDMESVLCEMEKLIDYKRGEQAVSERDVDDVCIKSLEVKIFDMVDAIGNKKPDIALDIYNNLLFLKESPLKILTMIARQFRIMMQSKYLAKKGLDPNEIAATIEQRSFVVREAIKQSRNFNFGTLMTAMDDCLACDIRIKTGKIADSLGVEMIILKYCT